MGKESSEDKKKKRVGEVGKDAPDILGDQGGEGRVREGEGG